MSAYQGFSPENARWHSIQNPFITDRRDRARAQRPRNILVRSPPSLVAGTSFSLKMNLDAFYGYKVTLGCRLCLSLLCPGRRAGSGLGLARPRLRPGWQ